MGKQRLDALNNVTLEVRRGEFVSIMGPSGSGKTTLLQIIGCLDRPTAGRVYLAGQDTARLSDDALANLRMKTVGFVFQMFNLLPRNTALENVALPLIFRAIPRAERLNRARKMLELVGLKQREYHLPAQLSGGERQRVAIARSLINNPKIILADEPTGNLDSKTGLEIIELLHRLNLEGKTIVLVTHNREIVKYSTRIIHLRDGQITEVENLGQG